MRTRLLKGLIAVLVLSLLTAGVFYMRKNHKHEQVKANYDTYMAQLDNLSFDDQGLLKLVADGGDDPEYDAIFEKKEKARKYLTKHAPHLLAQEEESERPYSRQVYIEYLREHDPAAAEKLEADLAEIDRKYEADIAVINAEASEFEQELIDHQADMEASRKRREAFELERLERRREGEAMLERLDRLMDEMREHLIFDVNGKIIGFNPPSVAPSDSNVSSSPVAVPSVGSNESQDRSPSLNTDLVEVSDIDIPAAPVSNPQFWRETINSEMAGLDVGFYEKYPDVMIRPYLSDTEYQMLFPTEQSRQQLQRRTTTLQTEYASGIRKMLEKTPRDKQSEMIQIAQQALSKDWDSDFVEVVINKVRLGKDGK